MLDKIADTRVRNLLRGILSASNDRALEDTLSNLRRETPIADVYEVYKFLDGPLARGFPKIQPFPKQPNRMAAHTFFEPAPITHELIAQRVRIENNEEKILSFVQRIETLNRAFCNDDEQVLLREIRSIPEEFGFSLFLLRKFLSIKHARKNSPDIEGALQAYLASYHTPRRDIIAVAFEDSIDSLNPYPKVRKTFLQYAAQNRFDAGTNAIIRDHFSPILDDSHSASGVLQAYGITSVIDAAVLLLSRYDDMAGVITAGEKAHLDGAVSKELRTTWWRSFQRIDLDAFTRHDEDEAKFFEYNFFRHTNAWSEYPEVERYRRWIEASVGGRLNGEPRTALSSNPAPEMPVNPCSLTELWKDDSSDPLNIVSFNPKHGGCLHRSIALMSLIEKGESGEELTGRQLLSLLDKTIDVAHLASAGEISSFLRGNSRDLLFQYLKAALIHDGLETGVSSHRLRKALENVVIEEFEADIVKFANFLYEHGRHVGNHCYHICTESFLVQLYKLFDTSNDVIEARAGLLEWYGEKSDQPVLVDRAKSLRLDIKLSKVRDDIDDNRIYVDPLRFHQWLSDHIASELRASIPLLTEWPQKIGASSDLTNPVAVIQNPELVLGFLLNKAFVEFCSNKFYGVDSYIGRRIRHGTLRGTMVSEVRSIVEDFTGEFATSEVDACEQLEAWIDKYESLIKFVGSDLLQLKSDSKTKGAIAPTISGPNKVAAARLSVEYLVTALSGDNPVPTAIATIPESCWLLLEVDLKRIRSELQRIRDQELMIDPARILANCDAYNIGAVSEVCRILNETVNRKFATLSLWLSKPNNISPTATLSLLFNAVLVEAREQIAGFSPEIREDGLIELDLYGHRYHYVYDILYILVYNAGRHGKPGGVITFTASQQKSETALDTFEVCIQSEIKDTDLPVEVAGRIEEAMTADIENALVTEGFSGLRKVRSLASQLDEITGFSWFMNDRRLTFQLDLTFPLT